MAKRRGIKPRPQLNSDGFVVCENCDNLASKELSERCRWNGCAACMLGEAAALNDYTDYFKTEPSKPVEEQTA